MEDPRRSSLENNLQQGLRASTPPIPKVRYTFECGDDELAHWHVRHFELEEGLSIPYSMTLDLTTQHTSIETNTLLGDTCVLLIDRATMQRSVFGLIDQVIAVGISAGRLCLRVRVVPALMLLKQRLNTRSWQDRTVPEILKEVLESAFAGYERSVEFTLTQSYNKRDFCVQYRESDFEFVSRLMEEEGIAYYFKHDSEVGREVLVLSDNNTSDPELDLVSGDSEVPIIETNEGGANVESIQKFEWCCTLHSTSIVQRNYSWLSPNSADVYEMRSNDIRGREREVYDPEERRIHEFFDGAKTASMTTDGKRQAQIKQEELASLGQRAKGSGNVIEFTPGYSFVLQGHFQPELDRKYLITRVYHCGDMPEENILEGANDGGGERYENHFECIPFEVTFRPPRVHRRPKIYGPQTALVTGPKGEELHTDEHGRIKVLFRWDRLSAADECSSFWVRVAQNGAGSGWGMWFLPRIGMEVVVEFLDGNPDRPLVTGCVYNGQNATPYKLPDEKTKSTIKSNSSIGSNGFNEFRFEDAKGREEIYLHGQKDWNIDILHDKGQTIGHDEVGSVAHDRKRQVGNDEQITVGNNRTRKVGNNESITVGTNQTEFIGVNRAITIGTNDTKNIGANQTITVAAKQSMSIGSTQSLNVGGSQSITVAAKQTASIGASQSLKIGGSQIINVAKAVAESVGLAKTLNVLTTYLVNVGGMKSETVGLSSTEQVGLVKQVSAGSKIELSCGSSKIVLEKGGKVTIEGTEFEFKSSGPVTIKGSIIDLNP